MPVPNRKNETNGYKKQRRWSLIGILSRKKKLKKSQESVDFCPYDGKINQKVAQNNHLKPSSDCPIEQYTCSPRLIRRCNSLQYTDKVSAYSNITGRPSAFDEWKSSQQSVYSSSSSACYSDIGAYANRNVGYGNQSAAYYYNNNNNIQEEYAEQTFPVSANVPAAAFRCYRNPITCNDNRDKPSSGYPRKSTGKKIPPPPPPRDPNVKAVYCFRNNRLVSRESDSTYFSQGSDDDCSEKEHRSMDDEPNEPNGGYFGDGATEVKKSGPRSRRPIQICDAKTLSTESADSCRTQTVEEALQELENIYNSLGLNDDEDLLDRAERRDLPTLHQNMRYQSSDDELDYVTFKRILPKSPRRSGVPDIVSDDMAYRRLHRKETKRQSFVPGSFLLVLPTVYNLDTSPRPPGEPDITLDDVVFRSRRQHLNFLKIPDRQPPFGIPLGPIVSAAPSDYLHAVPEGRYKPTFHRRKVPDTVEDDLAFRSLRKDNKYKTCFDFSFFHRNLYCKIDGGGGVPNAAGHYGNNNKLKNDTHWIIKKPKFPDNFSNNGNTNRRLKLLFDESAAASADNGQNLMVVKINHHKPIVLTGFTLEEANRLSMSFFRANLLRHPDSRDNNNDNTTTAYRAPPQLIDNYYCANNSNCSSSNNNSSDTADLGTSDTASAVKRRRPIRDGNLDGLSAARKRGGGGGGGEVGGRSDVAGKSQPNFRELIEREYAHRTYPSLTMTENPTADYDGRRRRRRRDENNTIKSRLIKTNNNNDNTIAVHSADGGAGAIITLGPMTGDEPDTDNRRTTGAPSSAAGPGDDSASPLSEYRGPDHAATSTAALGYTEVCLYITVYIYQLFNVNACSCGTLIALILLVALHVCRRFS